MKVPLRWLEDFVTVDLTPEELAHRLTMAGLEAERIEFTGADWDNVFVGSVAGVDPHPGADRLVLAEVHADDHHLTVVTGAPNIAAGQKVAVALAGARLRDGYADVPKLKTLKPGAIRGVRSEGMVCSEKELGLSDEHEGILILDPDAPEGAPLRDWLGDAVIEFEITPNLVHAFSIMGIAREVAALTRQSIRSPETADLASMPAADSLVTIEADDLCSRYLGVVLDGIEVGPSPAWLVRRLQAAGVRSINNVVDVTNYVMLEIGQPLHAFDLDRLHGHRVIVGRAEPGERMETLDHQERSLTPDMLLIRDADRPVAIAGVMGGIESEVDDNTTHLLLESATFDMLSVRHTARDLKLRTDASARFERGLDPELVGVAAARATQLLLEVCPGSRVTHHQDVYPHPVSHRTFSFPFPRIKRVLGIPIDANTVCDVLTRLGFEVTLSGSAEDHRLTVTVPTYRPDVTLAEDVIEEVARIVGYDALPETLPTGRLPHVKRDPLYRLQTDIRDVLAAAGCYEVITYVTQSDLDLTLLTSGRGPEDAGVGFLHRRAVSSLVRLVNPLQSDANMLRPTLLPSLLKVAVENRKHTESVRLFEVARVYLPTSRNALPEEPATLGLVMTGKREPLNRFGDRGEIDYWDVKGTLEALFESLGVTAGFAAVTDNDTLHPGRSATATAQDRIVGLVGELRPDVARQWGFGDDRVAVAEINVQELLSAVTKDEGPITAPRFLPVEQDFAIVVDAAMPAARVADALRTAAGPLATSMTLFDVYEGAQLGENKKSLAFRVSFTAPDRALTDAELNKTRGRIENVLKQQVGGTLRA
ncbi:MAG TPA: phenylalanine--tRNA ligase subunit beta [Thermomicrobiales bacterium]|nr:phenylalanine--tRNA ligase subunit beta [Thermomicrobiales bacterium]